MCLVLMIYNYILLARILGSWIVSYVRDLPRPLLVVYGVVYEVTEPVLKLARPLVPPIRVGMAALDLSPLLVFFILFLLIQIVCT